MLSHQRSILRRLHNLFDAFLTALNFAFVYLVRNYLAHIPSLEDLGHLAPFDLYAPLMLIACFLWPLLLNYHGLYDATRLRKAFVNVAIVFRSSLESTILLITIIFLFQMEPISRLFLIGFGFFNALALVTKDLVRRQYGLRRLLMGKNIRPVLVVGTPEAARRMILEIEKENYLGLKTVGVVLPSLEEAPSTMEGAPVVGTLKDWRQILHDYPVANVIFAIHWEYTKEIEKAISICREEGVDVWMKANPFDLNLPTVEIDYLATIPVVVFRSTPVLNWSYIFKLLLDRLFAGLLLVLLSPFFLAVAFAIYLTSGKPILYRQKRVGRFGQVFELYKFRTLEAPGKKPTPLGEWLRFFGLDELPQLINILKGEMSFVGPRPHILEEVKQYTEPWQRRRFSVRPGLTCYRQILRPQKVSFDEALALDLRYIDKWSFWADLFLIFKTVILLLKRLFLVKREV